MAAFHKQRSEENWAHFWAIRNLLVTLILNYCVMAELSRIIGRKQFKAIFFGPISTAEHATL